MLDIEGTTQELRDSINFYYLYAQNCLKVEKAEERRLSELKELDKLVWLAKIGQAISRLPQGYQISRYMTCHGEMWQVDGPDMDTRSADSLEKLLCL